MRASALLFVAASVMICAPACGSGSSSHANTIVPGPPKSAGPASSSDGSVSSTRQAEQGPSSGTPGSEPPAESLRWPVDGVAPGRYSYRDTGTTSSAGAPTTTSAPFTTQTDIVYDPVANGLQHSTTTTGGGSQSSDSVVRFTKTAVYLVDLRYSGRPGLDFSATGTGVLLCQVPPTGQWTWDLQAAGQPTTTLHGEYRFLGSPTVDVGGNRVATWEIQAVRTVTMQDPNGAQSTIISTETQWIDPLTFVAVQMKSSSTLSSKGVVVGRSDSQSEIESLTPAR